MEQLVELDHEVFLFLNNLGSSNWDAFWNFVTNKFSSIPFYALLVFLMYRSLGLKKTILALVFVALLITSTDQLANVFKHGFDRPRPCRQVGIMEEARFVAVRCGSFGFFSAHAASSAALAIYLGLILRRYWKGMLFILIAWSLLVSYSRIYVGVHYPGDVLVGLLIGTILGYLYFRIYSWAAEKYFNAPEEKTA